MYCHDERDDEILQGTGASFGELLSEVLWWSILAYNGDGEPKEHSGDCHEAIDPLPPRKPLPLDIAGSDKERNEDT